MTACPETPPDAAAAAMAAEIVPPRFVVGSTMRHVVAMTGTGAVGLVAVFAVDLLSLLYISRLGDPRLTAAVGLATVVTFLAISVNLGVMIAVGALVSRALGGGDRALARRLAASACTHSVLMGLVTAAILVAGLRPLLSLIGAGSETLPLAERFLWITLPSNALMALGMAFSAVLRGTGDASRAMTVTLSGGIATALLDPLLIFGLGLGLDGAALATIVSRLVFVLVGYHGAVRVHGLVARPDAASVRRDAGAVAAIAAPAMLTNIAPAFTNAFLAGVIARFGEAAIAGNAVIDRLIPVVFAGLYALSGAIGPILAQNWGAGRFDRMRDALRNGVIFTGLYVVLAWGVLAASRSGITGAFGVEGGAADLVIFFCLVSGAIWFFNGLLFVANASFNNLGFPLASTAFNWGRATLGTIPPALLGASLAGPKGALVGAGLGSVVFGTAAILAAFRTITVLERRRATRRG